MMKLRVLSCVAVVLVALAAIGCGEAADTAAPPPSPPTRPTPSPSSAWREVAWMNETATMGMAFSKPFTVSSPVQLVEWRVAPSGLYSGKGIGIYVGPAAKQYDLDDGSRLVADAKKNGPGSRELHLKPGRYVFAVDATPGAAFKVRISEQR